MFSSIAEVEAAVYGLPNELYQSFVELFFDKDPLEARVPLQNTKLINKQFNFNVILFNNLNSILKLHLLLNIIYIFYFIS